jgi:hypothetical protein
VLSKILTGGMMSSAPTEAAIARSLGNGSRGLT